jgi:N-acetylglucosamine malate deacetylase 1
MELDFLAIGAHADDVELGCGGTVAKLVSQGRKGAILDLTDGALGSRGDAATRLREAMEAARILGVERHCAGLPDGSLVPHDPGFVRTVAGWIRKLRPMTIFVHPLRDRHPDHEAAASLVREACFKAGLLKYDVEGAPFRPSRLFHYQGFRSSEPDFVVDVSAHWETRLAALAAYPSQFDPSAGGPTTIASKELHDFLEARSLYLGGRARCGRAEGFSCDELVAVDDPCALPQHLV